MPTVLIPSMLTPFCGGAKQVQVDGRTVADLLLRLDALCPGIRDHMLDDGELDPSLAVVIDGELSTMGLLERVREDSEVQFLPAIAGG